MWGHSMGGSITLQVMVATEDVKAGVIWAGMVGSYPEILEWWRQRWGTDSLPTPDPETGSRPGVAALVETYGLPDEAPEFWNAISATSFLSDLSGPLQLHHGTADSSVPHVWSEALEERMEAAGQTVEFYSYPGDNHNLSNNFSLAMERSVDFFDTYVKGVRE
jgi:dienelactone hydrolase